MEVATQTWVLPCLWYRSNPSFPLFTTNMFNHLILIILQVHIAWTSLISPHLNSSDSLGLPIMESLILPDHAALPLEPPCMSTCLPETTGTEYRYRVLVYYAYPDASYSPLSKQNEVQVRFHTHKHIDLDRNVSLEGFREARIPAEEAKLKKWADKKMHRFYRKHKTWCVQSAPIEPLQCRSLLY